MSDILVVGAGQLGLMMAAAGGRFATSVDRIDHVTGELVPGTSKLRLPMPNVDALSGYVAITAELEHLLGNPVVENLRTLPNWKNAEAMERLPSRDTQKALLDELNVATAPWRKIDRADEIATAHQELGDHLIVKSIRDGYDGKGQWRLGGDQPDTVPASAMGSVIAERRIPFRRELSLIGARFRNGEQVFYPLVENYHQAGMLRFTLAPASGIESLQDRAGKMLGTVMERLDYVGVMAMECFDTGDGLMVNELAPRVHNSGHWSQLGADFSQFDLHLFAMTDRPVPLSPVAAPCSLMLNLIGCEWNHAWQSIPGIQCWWYGKALRENRKLGHINISGSSIDEVVRTGRRLLPSLDDFHQEMLGMAIDRIQNQSVH